MHTEVPAATVADVAAKLGLLTSREVCRRSGITYRRLDVWTRDGKLVPAVGAVGSGSGRLFDPSVVEEIEALLDRIDDCPLHHGGRPTNEAHHERPRRP